MSHYDDVLQEARAKATHSAKEYIPKLYHILVDEEHKTAEDARKIIEHDLISYWAKATVTKFLPQEAKDEDKVKAGKKGAEATNLILAGGQTVTTEADDGNSGRDWSDELPPNAPTVTEDEFYNNQKKKEPEPEEDPKDIEIAFLKEELAQLKDTFHKSEQFKPATVLEGKRLSLDETAVFEFLNKRDNGVSCYWYPNYGIELFRTRILTQLKGKGVTTFRRLYFEV